MRSADSEMRATTKPTKPTRALIPGPSAAIWVRPGDAGEGHQVQGVTGKGDAETEGDQRQQRGKVHRLTGGKVRE